MQFSSDVAPPKSRGNLGEGDFRRKSAVPQISFSSFPFSLKVKNRLQEVLTVAFLYVSLEPREDPVSEAPFALTHIL